MVLCVRCGKQNDDGLDDNMGWIPILGYVDTSSKNRDRKNFRVYHFLDKRGFSLTLCLCPDCQMQKVKTVNTEVDQHISRFKQIAETINTETTVIEPPKKKKRGRPKKRDD